MNVKNIQNILRDDDFREVLKSILDGHTQTIINSNYADKEIREQAYHRISAINELIGSLESIAASEVIDENRFKIL